MKIKCIWEHNGEDSLLYTENFVGAFTRGLSQEVAVDKMQEELEAYMRWSGMHIPAKVFEVEIVQEKASELQICDADSDVIFETEKEPLSTEEYVQLKTLALKSAEDFQRLYELIPDKEKSVLAVRKTFYGTVPRNAWEMYMHTKSVNSYYFAEINVEADNEGTILECRRRGFDALEQKADFLENNVFQGSYGEEWSLRKVLRKFIWHDRIHAKAMYRMAKKSFGENVVPDVFCFEG